MPIRMRKIFCAAGAALLVGCISILFSQDQPAPRRRAPPDIVLVYVGADDCPPCRSWPPEAEAFRASPEFAAVTYREVKSPHLLDLLRDEYWPEELRPYRDRVEAGAGVPMWFIIADKHLVYWSVGMSQWRREALPRLRSLLN